MFLVEKYWSHCFLLDKPARFLQSSTHTLSHIKQPNCFPEILNQFILPSALPESSFYHTPLNTDSSQSSSILAAVLEVLILVYVITSIKHNVLPIFKSSLYRTLN